MTRIDIDSDGAKSVAIGDVDVAHFPEMMLSLQSHLHVPRMREIFFKAENWPIVGRGRLQRHLSPVQRRPRHVGHFHGERSPRSWTIASVAARLAAAGRDSSSTIWNARLAVLRRHATRSPSRPSRSARRKGSDGSFRVLVRCHVDLSRVPPTSSELAGQRFAGAATGRNLLEWHAGAFCESTSRRRRARRRAAARPRADDDGVAGGRARGRRRLIRSMNGGPSRRSPTAHLPITGAMTYRYDPSHGSDRRGRFASDRRSPSPSMARPRGAATRTAVPRDQRRLAGERRAAGRHHHRFRIAKDPVEVGGRGEFEA